MITETKKIITDLIDDFDILYNHSIKVPHTDWLIGMQHMVIYCVMNNIKLPPLIIMPLDSNKRYLGKTIEFTTSQIVLQSIISYFYGRYSFDGKYFQDLSEEQKESFRNYSFDVNRVFYESR